MSLVCQPQLVLLDARLDDIERLRECLLIAHEEVTAIDHGAVMVAPQDHIEPVRSGAPYRAILCLRVAEVPEVPKLHDLHIEVTTHHAAVRTVVKDSLLSQKGLQAVQVTVTISDD